MSILANVDISTQVFNKLKLKSFDNAELAIAAVAEAAAKVQGLSWSWRRDFCLCTCSASGR